MVEITINKLCTHEFIQISPDYFLSHGLGHYCIFMENVPMIS